jgi:C4-dicarboxylate transporter DctQ subunit
MAVFDKISNLFSKYLGAVIGVILLCITIILTINVIGRYCFGVSLHFGEELANYSIIWITFVGSGICVKKGIHVSVDAFINFMHGNLKKVFIIFGQLVGVAFSAMLIYVGVKIVMIVSASGQISPAMRLPMSFAYAAIPAGAFYMLVEYIKKILDMAINGIPEEEDDLDTIIEKSM